MRNWQESVRLLYCLLELERSAVGVKLLKTPADFDRFSGIELKKPINYCQMVKAASRGTLLKADSAAFTCRSGARVLGIDKADPANGKGENWARLGLYRDAQISKRVRESLAYSGEEQYGVGLAPLEKLSEAPDVIVLITNPYAIMRLTQGYAYHFGMPSSIRMIGNQAVCLECSANPFVTGDMNLSLLCIGTRHQAHWDKADMACGIPQEQFPYVVDGLLQTMNAMEGDSEKRRIEEKFRAAGIEEEIRYRYNYYMDC